MPIQRGSDCIVFLLFLITEDTYSLQSGKKKKVDHYWVQFVIRFVDSSEPQCELSQEYCLFRVVVAKIK